MHFKNKKPVIYLLFFTFISSMTFYRCSENPEPDLTCLIEEKPRVIPVPFYHPKVKELASKKEDLSDAIKKGMENGIDYTRIQWHRAFLYQIKNKEYTMVPIGTDTDKAQYLLAHKTGGELHVFVSEYPGHNPDEPFTGNITIKNVHGYKYQQTLYRNGKAIATEYNGKNRLKTGSAEYHFNIPEVTVYGTYMPDNICEEAWNDYIENYNRMSQLQGDSPEYSDYTPYDLPEYYWGATSSGPGGNGSSQSQSGNDTPTNNYSPPSPVSLVNHINNNLTDSQKTRLNELKQKAKTDTEHATVFYSDGTQQNAKGEPNKGRVNINWRRDKTVTMVVHNHTTRKDTDSGQPVYTVTCFSSGDIALLHQMVSDPSTKLSENFVFMVIHNKATYVANITDVEGFRNTDIFNDQEELNSKFKTGFQNEIKEITLDGYLPDSDETSTSIFNETFKGTGISLIKSNNSNRKDWTPDDKWETINHNNKSNKIEN